MKSFDYVAVSKPADAVRLIEPQSRFIAGGTNLVDLMKYGIESPDRLIDISRLPLARIETTDAGIRIGALARNSDVAADPAVNRQSPLLAEALLAGASPQLRNMATMGGNLMQRTRCYYFYDATQPCNKREPGSGCGAIGGFNRIHAILGTSEGAAKTQCIATNPSDMNVALSALDAVVQVTGPKGNRVIPVIDFHRLPGDTPERDTVLEANELITGIDIPKPVSEGKSHYLKVRDRASYAFAVVSVAARMSVEDGRIKEVGIALGGVAHKPWRIVEVEKNLVGKQASEDTFRAAAQQLVAGAKPHEHNAFKIQLAQSAIVRALQMIALS